LITPWHARRCRRLLPLDDIDAASSDAMRCRTYAMLLLAEDVAADAPISSC